MSDPRPRIVVIDDDPDLRALLAECLPEAGYQVTTSGDGAGLRRLMEQGGGDLVVLDLGLPGEDGLSLARWLREHHDVGIVMLTGADTLLDRVLGLEVGADDYLGKPFAPRELAARIAAVLRRRRPQRAATAASAGTLRFGRFTLELKPRRLLDETGRDLALSGMELDLVAAFAANAGKVLSRDRLLDLAPPRGEEPFDRSIDNRITRLRRKLERDPAHPELVKTIRGAGYLYPG